MRPGILVVLASCSPPPEELGAVDGIPIIAVGYDAYRHLEALPRIRIGDRAYMRSTYDRAGANEAADASHFVRQAADGTYVIVDVAGTGYLAFARANRWHGSPWHYTVDDHAHVVNETSTVSPDAPVADATFEPKAAFPAPLAETWSTTRGADLSWVTVPFESSLTLAHERTHYGTGYYIYHLFPAGIDHVSTPLGSWHEEAPPGDVVDLLGRAAQAPGDDREVTVDVPADGGVRVFALQGAATIRKLEIEAPRSAVNTHLVIRWDGRAEPSVDAPLGLLFGSGTFYDRGGSRDIVKALLSRVTIDGDRVRAALYFPMPFGESATIELAGDGAAVAGVRVAVRTAPNETPMAWQGYFHATYVDHGVPELGRDLVVLDTAREGEWCGTFNGMAYTFSDRAELSTLEGDPRMFFDDAESPQGHGTGTEEWAGGGDYWGGALMTLPLAGHPTGAPSAADARDAEDAIEGAYRFLVADAMPFGRNARIQLEHGGANQSLEHYRTVAYWYGRPGACLVPSDTLDVGDPRDEAAHGYASSGTLIAAMASWDGWGVTSPTSTETGRSTTDGSVFTLAIDPKNRGVLLRRTLDYAVADQRAEVAIAVDDNSPFEVAGIWYTAGSTTSLYSNPPGELDPGEHVIQISDRRWRDDEFLIPRQLTQGRSSIRIRVRVLDNTQPLFPGASRTEAAWTELAYRAYSYVL